MSSTLLDRVWHLGLAVAHRALVTWRRVFRARSFGVCVAVWSGGRVLLVRHSYKPGHGIPAGRRRRREAPEAAAARELREEVGIDVAPGLLRPAGRIVSREYGNEDHLDFFELELASEPIPAVDGREVVWAGFRRPEEALALDLFQPVREYLEGRAADQGMDSTV
jgi:ADP-ribose pyrophosphatase YjhB (NUDIX family)